MSPRRISSTRILRRRLEEWTVTSKGSLVPGVSRHFVRLNPASRGEATSPGAVDSAMLTLVDQPPGSPVSYPAREIVDAGFLQLTRYGIFDANDPLIVDSLRVVDETLKVVITPKGPCWGVTITTVTDSSPMAVPFYIGAAAERGPY